MRRPTYRRADWAAPATALALKPGAKLWLTHTPPVPVTQHLTIDEATIAKWPHKVSGEMLESQITESDVRRSH
jgi:hypothetical protein